MLQVKIPYAKEYWEVNLPDIDQIDIINPTYPDSARNEEILVWKALGHPIEKTRLTRLVNQDSKVAIIVDDVTRPTPTKKLLPPLMEALHKSRVKKENITIIFARGTHRRLTENEEKKLVGPEMWHQYRVVQHDFENEATLVPIKDSSGKSQIKVNKWAAEADLRILTGFIKPHIIAGYSGGAKSILPGIAGLDFIRSNHSYRFLSHPSCNVGAIADSPARQDMERKARCLEPIFILNVILNQKNEIVQAVAGDLVAAHRKGVEIFNGMAKVEVKSAADVVIVCCPNPTDLNLYQACFGAAVAIRTERPILRRGGVVVLVAHCPEGLGEGGFPELITTYNQPQELLRALAKPGFFELGQWGGQLWADILNFASVIMVSDGGIPKDYYRSSPMRHASSVEQAWEQAKKILNKKKIHGYILPQAPFTFPILSS